MASRQSKEKEKDVMRNRSKRKMRHKDAVRKEKIQEIRENISGRKHDE